MGFRVFGNSGRVAQFFNHFKAALRLLGFGGFIAKAIHKTLQVRYYALVLGGGHFRPFYGGGTGTFVRIIIAIVEFKFPFFHVDNVVTQAV